MADNLNIKGPEDRTRINTKEDWEVKYWSQKFDVSADRLRDAVRSVGTMARDVARHLGKPL
jgi:hypothetical protein